MRCPKGFSRENVDIRIDLKTGKQHLFSSSGEMTMITFVALLSECFKYSYNLEIIYKYDQDYLIELMQVKGFENQQRDRSS